MIKIDKKTTIYNKKLNNSEIKTLELVWKFIEEGKLGGYFGLNEVLEIEFLDLIVSKGIRIKLDLSKKENPESFIKKMAFDKEGFISSLTDKENKIYYVYIPYFNN
jgi:hypothetical protein